MGKKARKIKAVQKAAEGEYRPGPYLLNEGWIPAGSQWNFWQTGVNPRSFGSGSAMVEACVSAYAQTAAMCPGDHWELLPSGGRKRVTTSALSRILRKPNDYQSISDFMLNLVRGLYLHGNAFALAVRNDRYEITELHLMRSGGCCARVAEDGSIFYALSGNEIVERRFGGMLSAVPARDVLHVRLHSSRTPLHGESPLLAAELDVAAGNAALEQQLSFFSNQAKPSIMLASDLVLRRDQVQELREAWDAQTRGAGAGGTPILTGGLKPVVVSTTAVDAQLAETLKKSDQSVALAFRVPLQVLGIGGTPYASTEMLMQSWLASGLGFCLNHIEEAMGRLFGLWGVPDEYLEFNTNALLRSAFKDRIEAFARGAQAGIFSPDEARAEFELPAVEGGHGKLPRMQQQDVPLDYWDDARIAAEAAKLALPAPAPEEEEPAEESDAKWAESFSREIDDLARTFH